MIKQIFLASLMVISSQLVASSTEPDWGNINRDIGKHKKMGPWVAYSGTSGTLVSKVFYYTKTRQHRGDVTDTSTGKQVEKYPNKKALTLYAKFEAFHNPGQKKQEEKDADTSDISDIE